MADARFENTEIRITFRPTGTYKAPQTGTMKFKLTKEDGSAPSEATLSPGEATQTVTIAAKKYVGTEDEKLVFKVTAPKVPDKEEFYKISFKIDFPSWPTGARSFDGHTEYAIWPSEYVVETVRTGDAAKEDGKSEGDKFEKVAIEDARSNDDGKYTFVPMSPGPVAEFTIKDPYLMVEWVEDASGGYTKKCRKRKVKVDSKPWKAKILSHPDETQGRELDKAVVQWVNLDPADGADKGSLVKVDVGPTDVAMLGDRRKVHIKVTFPSDISKRNDPFPAVWKTDAASSKLTPVNASAKPGVDELVYDLTGAKALEIPAGKDRVTFYVQLGHAGGVYCHIEVGTAATALTDDQLYLEAWRRLQFETWQAKTDGDATTKLSSWTLGGTPGTPGISAAATQHLYQTFAGATTGSRAERAKACFIDWQQAQAGFYTKDTLESQSWIPVSGGTKLIPSWDGAFFDEGAGTKITVLTWGQIVQLAQSLNPAPHPRLNQVVFADYVATAEPWSQSFGNLVADATLVPNKNLLPWDIESGSVASDTVTEVFWKASVNDGTGWTADAAWTSVTDRASMDALVKVIGVRKVHLTMPNVSSRGYPATHQVRFTIFVRGQAWSWGNINGCALGGTIAMNRYAPSLGLGAVHPIGVTNVVIHEIGHNMGQAYGDKSIDSTFGRSPANMIPGIDNPVSVASGGDLYGGHGHTGTHCAFGLSATNKACASFGSFSGQCVMFGSDNMSLTTKKMWCANCKSYIRGTHLDDVRRSWSS